MKKAKKIVLVALSGIIGLTSLSPVVCAKTKGTAKEEVVYVNLNSAGGVKEIDVVNIFNMESNGTITDFGDYSSVRNMNTTDELKYENKTVIANVNAGKIFYEGRLNNTIIPWNISFKYYLNDAEVSPENILGQSGKLKIKMEVSKNKECKTNFFKDYALQIAFTFDTEKYSNIKTKGATVANVGKDKQLTYTVLPNSNVNKTINADVQDFEMESIAINGIKLNLDIKVDSSKIKSKIEDITDAVDAFDEASDELYNGTDTLDDSVDSLVDGVDLLDDGTKKIDSGAITLDNGLSAIASKSSSLRKGVKTAFKGICTAVSSTINSKLSGNNLGKVKLTPSNYKKELNKLLKKLGAKSIYKKAYATAKAQVTAQVNQQASELYKGYIEQNADTVYMSYIKTQSSALYEKVVKEAIIQTLTAKGYTEEEAKLYLDTEAGKALIKTNINSLTTAQKEEILSGAVSKLTTEQKQQILKGAISALTNTQKKQIRTAYIEKLMAEDSVTKKINNAVAKVGKSAKQISSAKGQLDSFKVFYQGVIDYTSAVDTASKGASSLRKSLDTLYSKTNLLNSSMSRLSSGVSQLLDGTDELKDGAKKFSKKTKGIDKKVDKEIDSMLSKFKSNGKASYSFVSDSNKNVQSVQFVIKTDEVKKAEEEKTETQTEELNFWQKLLKLFGLYNNE